MRKHKIIQFTLLIVQLIICSTVCSYAQEPLPVEFPARPEFRKPYENSYSSDEYPGWYFKTTVTPA
ncbi:MAG: hypothetical protein ACRC2T_17600, partial [Thermoguttaceae bacterium]